jgi:hypothetical protein
LQDGTERDTGKEISKEMRQIALPLTNYSNERINRD